MAGVILDKVDLHATHNLMHILIYRMQRRLATYGSLVRKDPPIHRPATMFLDLLHNRRTAT